MSTASLPTLSLSVAAKRALLLAVGLGTLVFFVGLAVEPARAWGAYLIAFNVFVGLALAGPLFLAIVYLSNGRWAMPLRRVPEAMGGALGVAGVLGLVLIIGTHTLYEWSHAQVVQGDALLRHKAPWLNVVGYSVRMVVYFAIWIWIARRLAARSSATEPEPERRRATIRDSATFMALFAVTFSLASLDWIQSLDPHWFSSMFALRTASGVCLAGLAFATIVLVEFRRRLGLRDVVTKHVLDDLGKVLLALSLFWAYIWYCQYMIVWYTNIPEETGYYLIRRTGDWTTLLRLNFAVNFGVPFLALMLGAWRRNAIVLQRIAMWILLGRVLDLFVLIAPPLQGVVPRFGLWEVGPVIAAFALFVLIFVKRLARESLVPREMAPDGSLEVGREPILSDAS